VSKIWWKTISTYYLILLQYFGVVSSLFFLFYDYQIQEKLEVERRKLEELEAEHQETCRRMKEVSGGRDAQAAIGRKHRREQHELEHQRHVLDDLEFQMFEVDKQTTKCCKR